MRKVQSLTAILLAAIALSVVGAASAEAAPEFHAGWEPVIFEGEQVVKHVFTFTGGTASCKFATFRGTNTTSTSTTVKLAPSYSSCTAFGRAATVDTNGCGYQFHLAAGSSPPTAKVDLECFLNEIQITVPSPPCTVTLPWYFSFGSWSHVTFANGGSGASRDFLATFNISNLAYTEEGSGCLGTEVGTPHTNGKYTGTATIKAYVDINETRGAQVAIWVE